MGGVNRKGILPKPTVILRNSSLSPYHFMKRNIYHFFPKGMIKCNYFEINDIIGSFCPAVCFPRQRRAKTRVVIDTWLRDATFFVVPSHILLIKFYTLACQEINVWQHPPFRRKEQKAVAKSRYFFHFW